MSDEIVKVYSYSLNGGEAWCTVEDPAYIMEDWLANCSGKDWERDSDNPHLRQMRAMRIGEETTFGENPNDVLVKVEEMTRQQLDDLPELDGW